MRGRTAATQRLGSVTTGPHRGRQQQTGSSLGLGLWRARKAAVEYLLFQPDRGNPAVRDDSGARWNRGRAG